MNHHSAGLSLFFRIHHRLCSLPLACVVETMRPLPLEPLGGAPAFVSGLALVRGEPVPVVDAARLLGVQGSQPGRWVTLTVGERRVALAVDTVLGVAAMDEAAQQALPPLLAEAGADVVAAIGTRDAQLLLLLDSTRVVPQALWAQLSATKGTAA